MIEYDRFIYLDVYRTGSSHVLKVLAAAAAKKPLRFHRHAALTKGRPFAFLPNKFVFATVRNPWDWYVSLWAFGADGKSAIRRYLTAHYPEAEVAALYDRQDATAAFRRWLRAIHDPAVLDRIMTEHLPQSGLSTIMGLYSYRFLRVTTLYPRLLLRRALVTSAMAHLSRFKAYREALRSEELDDGLARLARERLGFPPEAVARIAASGRTNASGREADYRPYYDQASRDLVARRDALFLEEFGYRF